MYTKQIALYHKSYNEQHLAKVKAEMVKRGAPTIKCIWSECYGVWMAVEGCHRLRAAKDLGLMPVILNIAEQKTVTVQVDGESRRVSVAKLTAELNSTLYRTEVINF